MDLHKNARLSLRSRESLVRKVVEEKLTLKAAAAAFSVSRKTAAKWVRRFRQEPQLGLVDRSSRPRRLHRPTPRTLVVEVAELRRQRWTGCRIAAYTGLSPATVSRILRRCGLHRLSAIEPPRPANRYEHPNPGDLLHLDIKKLGRFRAVGHRIHGDYGRRTRGCGWEHVHVAVDDRSRIAFVQIRDRDDTPAAIAFLQDAIAYFRRLGIHVRGILTDNGGCYVSRTFAKFCQQKDLRHRRTRPYSPRTNGKAERFIQTALREWAYARSYDTSEQRRSNLLPWLHQYNWHRPHASLAGAPPISRSGLDGNNLLIHHI